MIKEIKKVEVLDKQLFIQEFYNIFHKEPLYIIGINYRECITYCFPYIFSKDENHRRVYVPLVFRDYNLAQDILKKLDFISANAFIAGFERYGTLRFSSFIDLIKYIPVLSETYGLEKVGHLSLEMLLFGVKWKFYYDDIDRPNNDLELYNLVGYDTDNNQLLRDLEHGGASLPICEGYSEYIDPLSLLSPIHEMEKENKGSDDRDVSSRRKIYYNP